jgi:hypothetical protein
MLLKTSIFDSIIVLRWRLQVYTDFYNFSIPLEYRS